jgi:hypothetical protein
MSYYISVRQPFAEAIIRGLKDIENRDWPTKFRGKIYIHAGRSRNGFDDSLAFVEDVSGVQFDESSLVFGAFIGSVEIVDCVKKHKSPWFVGDFGFVLQNPVRIKRPVPFIANTGIRPVPDDLLGKL